MQLIVAIDEHTRGIGVDGNLLCRIPEDMAFFRSKTLEKTVLMGHNTLKSLPNSTPLKDRCNIIMSHDPNLEVENAIVCHDVSELPKDNDIYVIGGQSIYELLLPFCDTAYITELRFSTPMTADKFFPELGAEWTLMSTSERHFFGDVSYQFKRYERSKIL
ncbi:dihydrofolate reductase [Clostridia bacterium]|nr:dihydrofolate reductase [Clostridia bacterium]